MNDQFPILDYFDYDHLPEDLQEVSKPFHELAHKIVESSDQYRNPAEIAAGLRKLLEAKDCIVRSRLS